MKYLTDFLKATAEETAKTDETSLDYGFVGFGSENGTQACAQMQNAPTEDAPLIVAVRIPISEQEQRIRTLSRPVSRKAAWRALQRVHPKLHLNAYDRLELALSLALLDAGIDFREVLSESLQNQSD